MSQDNEDIIKSVERIRSKYRSELEDSDEETMSFIDEINELIRKIFKDDPADIYTALSTEQLERWKSRRYSRYCRGLIRRILSFLLCVKITRAFYWRSEERRVGKECRSGWSRWRGSRRVC